MSLHAFLTGPAAHFWHDWQPALIALAIAIAVRFGAHAAGRPQIAVQAPGIGALAGWLSLSYRSLAWPLNEHSRLIVLGLVGIGSGLAAGSLSRGAQVLTVALALFSSWLLLGAPFDYHDMLAILAQGAILGALSGITILWLRHANAWTIVFGAFALWINLTLAGAPVFWQLIAAAGAAGSLTLLGRGAGGAGNLDEVGVASMIAFAAVTIDLSVGKLRQDGFTLIDLACCSPLLTGFVAPRLGQNDIVLGSILGAVGSTMLLWASKTFS